MKAALRFALVLALQASALACLASEVAIPAPHDPTIRSLPAKILKPEGGGPFAAIVLLHDCSGLGPRSSGGPARWAAELVPKGYVVILPDSFTPRGHAGGICTVPFRERHPNVTPTHRAQDAYATLAFLHTLPYVDTNRVGVMGASHGGASTLATMVAPQSAGKGFIAGVALYPGCALNAGHWRSNLTGVYENVSPLYILIGEADDWTPAENCRRLADSALKAGHPVSLKVYPGAHHSFDSAYPVRYNAARINLNVPGGRGATTGGDPAAWADSIREVTGFFARHLGRTP